MISLHSVGHMKKGFKKFLNKEYGYVLIYIKN